MFSQLEVSPETRRRRRAALLGGSIVQIAAILAIFLLSVLFPQKLPLTKHYMLAWLPPIEPPKPHQPPPPPPKPLPRVVLPKVVVTPQVPKLVVPPEVVEVKPPKVPPPPVTQTQLPAPPPVMAAVVAPPRPKQTEVVHTGSFGGAPDKVTLNKPASQVQTGGFGSPEGFKGTAKGDSLGNVPKLGSFSLPEGPGVGNGTGGKHGAQGVIASSGFGSGIAGPGHGTGGGGPVAMGKFEQERQVAPPPSKAAAAPVQPDTQPIEILYKPSPVYTEEARRLAIQGDVALSVIFLANGSIKILGLVNSLGHGLDQEAEREASQIRFKPAMRAGKPTDFPATIRIVFRLAG